MFQQSKLQQSKWSSDNKKSANKQQKTNYGIDRERSSNPTIKPLSSRDSYLRKSYDSTFKSDSKPSSILYQPSGSMSNRNQNQYITGDYRRTSPPNINHFYLSKVVSQFNKNEKNEDQKNSSDKIQKRVNQNWQFKFQPSKQSHSSSQRKQDLNQLMSKIGLGQKNHQPLSIQKLNTTLLSYDRPLENGSLKQNVEKMRLIFTTQKNPLSSLISDPNFRTTAQSQYINNKSLKEGKDPFSLLDQSLKNYLKLIHQHKYANKKENNIGRFSASYGF